MVSIVKERLKFLSIQVSYSMTDNRVFNNNPLGLSMSCYEIGVILGGEKHGIRAQGFDNVLRLSLTTSRRVFS